MSVEHIIPESLWNTNHVLPPGVVCDTCNNYFARKIERPFLETPSIQQLRFQEAVPNKRGRIPFGRGILGPNHPATLQRYIDGPIGMVVDVPPEAITDLAGRSSGTLLIPMAKMPSESVIISRFLAKMSIEGMAYKVLGMDGGVEYIAEESQLDPIRNFARKGQPQQWPHYARRIYDAKRACFDPDGNSYQTVHEFDFLVTEQEEWYFIFALFGFEYAINMGGPEIDGYVDWLRKNNQASPLYTGKNADD